MVSTARSSVRVLIIEDHELFAESVELALTLEGYDVRRISVLDPSMSSAKVLSTVTRLRPRIVLLDLDLGRLGDGIRLINPMARSGANVVVVTSSMDRVRWGECVRNGARKVMDKTRPLNEVRSTVRRLSQGLPVMDREEREELLQLYHEQRHRQQEMRLRLERLTVRERQVLGRLMEGQQVRDIARVSVVTEATVRTQVKSILAKLQVSSQIAAVGLAHFVGWQGPRD